MTRRLFTALVPLFTIGALVAAAAAQQSHAEPAARGVRALLEIQRAPGSIRIDGELDDEGWLGAASTTSFTEFAPRENSTPPVRTEVLVTYDDRNLYVAFIAHDDPAQIRATLSDRDQIFNDDHVGVLIDPFGEDEIGYFFLANPLGVQADLLMAMQSEDMSFDAVFQTAGRITESGYQVEMAIPFRSLRFPDRPVQSWKINFYRNVPRSSRHQITWAPLSMNDPCLLCQNGGLVGLAGVRPGGGLELLPAVVASQAGRLPDEPGAAGFDNDGVGAELSLGAKYPFASGWTAEATYNPDFSQVESDAAQIDVNTTFALFFPERRPFFQEGSDIFDTRINVFYSRSINAPQLAGKLTGRTGRTSVGYVGARDRHTPYILPFEERSAILQGGRSFSNVLRVRQNLSGGSHFGGLLTDRRLEAGGSGTTAGVDALVRFGEVYRIEAQLVGSYTVEPDDTTLTADLDELGFGRGSQTYTAAFDGESFAGHAGYLSLIRSARHWSWDLAYREISATYRADTGFQTRNDFRRATFWSGYTFYPDHALVDRFAPSVNGGSIWNFDGERKEVWIAPGVFLMLKRQTQINIHANFRRETFREVPFDGLRRFNLWMHSNFSEPVQFGMSVGHGRSIARTLTEPQLGEGTDFEVWATLKPTQRLVIQPSLAYADLSTLDAGEELYSGYIARTRFNYQFTRELFTRVVLQYNDFNRRLDAEPLLIYRLNPFTIFYVGSTHGFSEVDAGTGLAGSDRQFFLKFQYLFQL